MRASTNSAADPFLLVRAGPQPLDAAIAELRLGAGSNSAARPVETVDLDEDCAGFRGAATAQRRVGAFERDAPEIGGDPNVRAQAHRPISASAGRRRQLLEEARREVARRGKRMGALEIAQRRRRRRARRPVGLDGITELDQRALRRQPLLFRVLGRIGAQASPIASLAESARRTSPIASPPPRSAGRLGGSAAAIVGSSAFAAAGGAAAGGAERPAGARRRTGRDGVRAEGSRR